MNGKTLAILGCAILVGCVGAVDHAPQSQERIAEFRAVLLSEVRDPSAAQMRNWRFYDLENGRRAACVEVNGKNGFGGFTGWGDVAIYKQNGNVVFLEGSSGAFECGALEGAAQS